MLYVNDGCRTLKGECLSSQRGYRIPEFTTSESYGTSDRYLGAMIVKPADRIYGLPIGML